MSTDEQFNFPIGTRVGDRYVLTEELGRGGYAVVYLVHDQHFPVPVQRALKFLKITKDAADWRWERFREESSRLAPMSHPGLVNVMDHGIHDGFPYFVMEYLGRRTLHSILKETPGGLTLDLVLKIINELADVLVCLHEQNLFHCDLKPANVMLYSHGGGEQVKLIDLGIARLMNPSQGGESHFSFPPEGTPAYMAPEQFGALADCRKISAATDIYAFGIIAYELLTSVHPFQNSHPMMARQTSHIIPASELRAGLTNSVDTILLKALADDPAERYQSAAKFAEDLRRAVEMNVVGTDAMAPKALLKGRVLVLAAESELDQRAAIDLAAAFTDNGYQASYTGVSVGLDIAETIDEELQNALLVLALVSTESLVDAVWLTLITQTFEVRKAKQLDLVFVPLEDDLPIPPEWRTSKFARWRPDAIPEMLSEIVEGSPTPSTLFLLDHALSQSSPGSPYDSDRYYVQRQADITFLEGLKDRQPTLLVNGPRQFGKTSLLLRGQATAERLGFRVVKSNCKALDHDQLTSMKKLYLGLAHDFSHQLKLATTLPEAWDDFIGANKNFEYYLQDHALPGKQHLLWILDGADRIFRCPYPDDVFSMLRTWHEAKEWNRLTLAIGYTTPTRRLIDAICQSPFNVGIRCHLSSFTIEQVADLNSRYGSPLATTNQIVEFYEYTGGHPALTQQGLQYLTRDKTQSWNEFRQVAALSIGPFDEHLRILAKMIQDNSQMREGLVKLLQNGNALTEDEFYELWASGILAGSQPTNARISCRLYEDFFRRELELTPPSRSRRSPRGQRLLERFRKRS